MIDYSKLVEPIYIVVLAVGLIQIVGLVISSYVGKHSRIMEDSRQEQKRKKQQVKDITTAISVLVGGLLVWLFFSGK